MWAPGMGELLIIFAIVLLIFGGGKIAGIGRSMGTAITEFRDAMKSGDKSDTVENKTAETQRTEKPEHSA